MNDDKIIKLATEMTELSENEKGDILAYAHKNRLLEPILTNYDLEYELLTRESVIESHKIRLGELTKLVQKLKYNGINYACIKGIAFKKYYPETYYRQSNDFDLVIDNMDDFFKCFNILSETGYSYMYYPVFTKYDNKVRGTVKFNKEVHNTRVVIEINIGGFTISELTWIDSADILKNMQDIYINKEKINIPSDQMNLNIFLAEACGRESSLLRDNVDFYYFTKFINSSRINLLLPSDNYMKKVYKGFSKINEYVVQRQSKRDFKNKYYGNWRLDVYHTIPAMIKKSPKSIYFNYFTRLGGYFIAKDKLIKFFKKWDEKTPIRTRFNRGIPISFIPISQEIKGPLSWKECEERSLLITPIGTYHPSGFCLFTKEEADNLYIIKEIGEEGAKNSRASSL